MASNFIWYELMTTDVAAAETFYKNVVGWRPEPFAGMDYVVFNAGERAVAGLMLLPEEAKAMGTPPCWLGYIHANDVDAATASLKKAGGAVHKEPSDIPEVGRFSVVADPAGRCLHADDPARPRPGAAGTGRGRAMSAGASSTRPTGRRLRLLLRPSSDGQRTRPWIWAKWAPTRSSRSTANRPAA